MFSSSASKMRHSRSTNVCSGESHTGEARKPTTLREEGVVRCKRRAATASGDGVSR